MTAKKYLSITHFTVLELNHIFVGQVGPQLSHPDNCKGSWEGRGRGECSVAFLKFEAN